MPTNYLQSQTFKHGIFKSLTIEYLENKMTQLKSGVEDAPGQS